MSGRAARAARIAKVQAYFRVIRLGFYIGRWHRHCHRMLQRHAKQRRKG